MLKDNMSFTTLGLPTFDEDVDENNLPFEELEEDKPKDEIFAYVRKFSEALQDMGAGPYTLFQFKQQCNLLARQGQPWKRYLGLCAKFMETQVNKQKSFRPRYQQRQLPSPRRDDEDFQYVY